MTQTPIAVHVTEVLDCWKKRDFRRAGIEEAPRHFLSFKGSFVHESINARLTGKALPDLSEAVRAAGFEESEREISDTVALLLSNYERWRSETKFNLENARTNIRLEMEVNGAVLRGELDLFADGWIIDFKTSQPSRYKDTVRQLAAYKMLCEANGLEVLGVANVFLGGRRPVEKRWSQREVASAQGEFISRFNKLVEEERMNRPHRAHFTFECGWCAWRHLCRGV